MIVGDYFCGTKSVCNVAQSRGHKCITLDIDKRFNPDIVGDIMTHDLGMLDYAHFSPPCNAFSVASIYRHWKDGKPTSTQAIDSIKILRRIAQLISSYQYSYWTIENPRGMMRKVLPDILMQYDIPFQMHTVTYCQYGDTRMKPTDIFTNMSGWVGKSCKKGAPCHTPAPRGSKTGTQGMRGSITRSVIPESLIHEWFNYIEVLIK